jgi:O-acetyl-ADP-ribose deacetylase (regulator of RNase III)/uncharacterized protein YwgA
MIRILKGNIFDSEAQTLVNTVNCVGVMGKGIALGFKERYPEMYSEYVEKCSRGEVRLGRPYLYKTDKHSWILNFPTKDHWRSLAKVSDIIEGLQYLVDHYKSWGITSLAMPPLGTGQGQLEWRVVGPILYKFLSMMNIQLELYAPLEAEQDELELSFLQTGLQPEQMALKPPSFGRIGPAWIALVEILRRIQSQHYHWPVGRTSFQKMAFLANNEALPLGLKFTRGSYGPYSRDLKPALARLQNNGLILERRSGKMFEVLVGPIFDQAYQTFAADIERWNAVIHKVADLFMRSNTRRAEMIATVIFAANEFQEIRGRKPTEHEVVEAVMEWKQQRKPALNRNNVALTVRNLGALRWLNVNASPNLKIGDQDFAAA